MIPTVGRSKLSSIVAPVIKVVNILELLADPSVITREDGASSRIGVDCPHPSKDTCLVAFAVLMIWTASDPSEYLGALSALNWREIDPISLMPVTPL